MASKLKIFIHKIQPIYVSDHVACFNVDGLPIPVLYELDYVESSITINCINLWQDLLGIQAL